MKRRKRVIAALAFVGALGAFLGWVLLSERQVAELGGGLPIERDVGQGVGSSPEVDLVPGELDGVRSASESGVEGVVEQKVEEPESQGEEVMDPRVLAGTVMLPDGAVLADVQVLAFEVGVGGVRKGLGGRVTTDEHGLFRFDLDPGVYGLEVGGPIDLPVQAQRPFETGQEGVRVLVDALLITLEARSGGQAVELEKVGFAGAGLDKDGRSGTMNSSRGMKPGMKSETVLLPAAWEYQFVVEGVDDVRYVGLVRDNLRAGAHLVTLRTDAPEFGKMVFVLDNQSLGEAAQLIAVDVRRDGERRTIAQPVASVEDGRIELELWPLLPGEYRVRLTLHGGGVVSLSRAEYTARVDAGGVHPVTVEAMAGGVVVLSVRTASKADGERDCILSVQRDGEDTWTPLPCTTRYGEAEGYAESTLPKAVVNGPKAISKRQEPGRYKLRLEMEGLPAEHRDFEIVSGETEVLEVVVGY